MCRNLALNKLNRGNSYILSVGIGAFLGRFYHSGGSCLSHVGIVAGMHQ